MSVSVAERPPRIRFVVNSLRLGGAERHLVDLIRGGVASRRFKADVVCLKELGPLASDLTGSGVPVAGPWLRGRFDLRAVLTLLRAGRRQPVDLVYTHHGVNELLLARLSRLALRTRSVAAVHATPDVAHGAHFSRAQRWLLRTSDVVVAVAPSQRELLVQHERLDPRRTVVIANGVDHTRFRPASEARNDVSIGSVGSLLPEKGHALLLEAMPLLLNKHPDAHLTIVGSGPCEPKLAAQARLLGISERVALLGAQRNVESLLPRFNVFALPSLPGRETLSVAALEAMSCGVPVVVSQVGSMRDLVHDGNEGYLVPPGDGTTLAKRIADVLDSPTHAREMGLAGRRRVETDFRLDAMVEHYCSLFDRLVQQAVTA